MKKPNFFIIGAPKCGTTSLAVWIGLHSKVYMSQTKEPNYFNTDISIPDRIGEPEYKSLFECVKNELYIGEASTRYLYSKVACKNVLSYSPEAKFVAIVRNPVDMIYSLHNHLRFLGVEPIKDFEEAVRDSDNRVIGNGIMKDCNDPDSLLYKKIGLLGKQVELFFSVVPPEQRLLLCFDDLYKDPDFVYKKLLSFLEIEYEKKIDFRPVNKSMVHRSVLLNNAVSVFARIKMCLGIKNSYGLLSQVQKLNRKDRERPPLPESLRKGMIGYFYQDIKILEDCLQRDLSPWYSSEM